MLREIQLIGIQYFTMHYFMCEVHDIFIAIKILSYMYTPGGTLTAVFGEERWRSDNWRGRGR